MKLRHKKLILNHFLIKSVENKAHTLKNQYCSQINISKIHFSRCRREGIIYWFYPDKVKFGCENR